MDTRQLRSLLAIAAHGSFARAAEVVHLTPSAIGQQIRALERELGVRLFDRGARPPRLTPHGLQVVEMARDILRTVEEAKLILEGEKVAGTLMLGSVRSSALNMLPAAIVRMRQLYPELRIGLRVSLSTTLIADVASGRLDAAVVVEHVAIPPRLRWSPFLREPLWVIVPPGVDIRDPVEMLKTEPFVRFASPVPLAQVIDAEMARLGITTNDVAEIDTIGSIVTCVRQGLGISVVPHVALHDVPEHALVRLPFGKPQLFRQIGIVERTMSPRQWLITLLHEVLVGICQPYGVPSPSIGM